MRDFMLCLCLLWPVAASADPLVDTTVRLLNPPAFRLTCLPFADFSVIEPVEVGQIPKDSAKQKAFLDAAIKQRIYIGFENVGPFEENKGALEASCEIGESTIHAKFSYYNYPTIFDANGTAISAQGFLDGLNSLKLESLTINGTSFESWPKEWPDFMSQCSHPECPAKLNKLLIYPEQQNISACFADAQCVSP